ncbi:MAG: glycosyltransferase family 2 protein [Planctomycetes bacterium]|jgi:glycosyltransferase involved in cell wall biosynthesis|nr:glycosyltransferase family 2 protein [Planctomycetota bacterium]MCL4730310.1 glycosyltransferase family 2 protein [Planctomycetota bacterium]
MPTASPTVSIIIPTFNRANLLPAAVRSVLAQTWRPLELVVVNDGSTDSTPGVLATLEPEIRAAGVTPNFVTRENGGLARARGTGADAATGDWFGYLDDDDSFDPRKTELQVRALLASGADAACCFLTRVTPEGSERHPAPPKRLLTGKNPAAYVRGETYAHINSMLVPRRLWPEIGPFDPELKVSQDVEWCARLAHLASFCAVEQELGRYEYNPNAVSRVSSLDDLIRRDHFFELVLRKTRERNHTRPNWDEQAWRDRVANDFDQFTKHLLYAGRLDEARVKWRWAMDATGGHTVLRKTARKLRKARWLGLFGLRLKHPKFGDQAVRM